MEFEAQEHQATRKRSDRQADQQQDSEGDSSAFDLIEG